MKQLTGKAQIRLLERLGWRWMRINEGHHVLGKKGSDVRVSVPVHGNKPLKIGLARHLLKMAGISENSF